MLAADLKRARQCYRRHVWKEAYELFSRVDQHAPLVVDDLERLAISAHLVGNYPEFHRHMERAHDRCVQQGEHERAARSAFWLSLTLFFQGDEAQANGWLARAERLVAGSECSERGYVLLPSVEEQLIKGDGQAAYATAAIAAEIGTRFDDTDLIACARHLQGRALIKLGEVRRGLGLLDETMLAVSKGRLSPIMTGMIYCSVIEDYQRVFALGRAWEWTSVLTRWCDDQPDLVAFTGSCLIYRSEIMQFRGAWVDAMAEARRACERSSRAGKATPSAALYRQGEIHRLRGDVGAAEEAYRTASRLGCEPQPGLALLRLAQGRLDAAGAMLQRVLSAATDSLTRARHLPAYIEVALAAKNLQDARNAAGELDEIARRFDTTALHAMAASARGAVRLEEGHAQSALNDLRRASQLWQESDAPYEAARARALIAVACREMGDAESAELEFDAAEATFRELGALPDVARVQSLRANEAKARTHRLTARELQVLRQISAGDTNKTIAGQLHVSERTIDRHVSSILTKLGVPSRAAATAYAYHHKLL